MGEDQKAARRRRRYEDDEDEDSDEEEDREERIPVPPIPDLRYEQGVLASIRPFLHRIDGDESGQRQGGEGAEKEKKVLTAEKSALASAQLTAEGSSKRESASDALMAPLRIEWSKVTYVIVRDQVRRLLF